MHNLKIIACAAIVPFTAGLARAQQDQLSMSKDPCRESNQGDPR